MIKLDFTMSELLKSEIAEKYNIYNVPDKEHLDNLLLLICNVLQPLRNYIGKPIVITSGYRNPRLNSHPLINGKPNSQHTEGKACDFVIKGMNTRQIVDKVIASGVEFDQLIDELSWVHVSFNKGNNRKQVLKISS